MFLLNRMAVFSTGRLASCQVEVSGGAVLRALAALFVSVAVLHFGLSPSVVLGEDGPEGDGATSEEAEAPKKPSKRAKEKPTPIRLDDARGDPDLTVCSQNLKLYGTFDAMRQRSAALDPQDYNDRTRMLIQRFVTAKCDVVAVQEVIGRTQEAARQALEGLAEVYRRVTNRTFDVVASIPGEGGMGAGFLVARDRAEIGSIVSYAKVELPKMVAKQKPRLFPRNPVEIQLTVRSKESDVSKTITLVNFHFKSKRGGQGDPTGLEWETYRMEMAEALRRIVERRHKHSFASGNSLLILLGDRNSNFDVASARILEGSLVLSSFQNEAPCRLSKRGLPICRADQRFPQRLFSVLTTNPVTKGFPGTFEYKGEYSWLDEILMPAESLPYAWETPMSEGRYQSGVVYSPKDASDHALVWVRLNW